MLEFYQLIISIFVLIFLSKNISAYVENVCLFIMSFILIFDCIDTIQENPLIYLSCIIALLSITLINFEKVKAYKNSKQNH